MQTGTIPSVSVVIPAYNAEKYLREAIDSILAQTYTDFELIIINDGSIDSTKDIILSYNDPRIVYLENEQNSGICVTLNKGLDAARGRYIARMDSDDIMMTERLAVQVDYMDWHPEIGACGSDIEIFGEEEPTRIFTQLHTPEECYAGLLFNSCFAHPSVILRKDVLDNHNLRYDDNFRGLEDYELWWRIAQHSKLNNIAIPLLRYRHHKGQETKNVSLKVTNAYNSFISKRFSDIGIKLSEDHLHLLEAYSYGNWSGFDKKEIVSFIKLSKRILSIFSKRERKIYSAIQLTLSKAITFTISHLNLSSKSRQALYNRALLMGIFSLLWFSKVSYHNLQKK